VRHAAAARLTTDSSPVPIYDYVCSNCGHLTEVVHGIHDGGPKFCPNCGTEGSMTKAFAAPAIHFKGSGWAKKDRSSTSSSRSSSTKMDDPAKAGSSTDSGSGAAGGSGDGGSSSGSGSAPAASTGD
jgi:putative FmdB family regulatory protein